MNSDSRFYYLSLLFENQKWSIHGLWPQLSKKSYPQFCKPVTFNPDLLNPIYKELDKCWHSDRGSDNKFWEHEWKKHGSCFFKKINEFEYFNTTLKLYKMVQKLGIIENYRNGNNALIPFDLNLNLLKNI